MGEPQKIIPLTITPMAPGPLAVLDLWGDPAPAAARLATVLGHALPTAGRAAGDVLRIGPNRWWVEGETEALAAAVAAHGAVTPIGGGIARVRLAGAGWRALLMEDAVFDAESPAFAADCVATTLIHHIAVTLRVEAPQSCLAYIPASLAAEMLAFWARVAPLVATRA